MAVGLKVIAGTRPSRPEIIIPDGLWRLLQDCWEHDPGKRPKVDQIIRRLVNPPIGGNPTQSAPDWDETFSSKIRRSLQDWTLPSVTGLERRVFGAGAFSLPFYLARHSNDNG